MSSTDFLTHLRANRLSQDLTIGRILAAQSPADQGRRRHRLAGFAPADPAALADRLRATLKGSAGLVLGISHDHYLTVGGGVQNCIGLEQEAFGQGGYTYLHLCPDLPLLTLAEGGDDLVVLATVDGVTQGLLPWRAVAEAIVDARPADQPCLLVVHHLLGHSPELVADLAARLPGAQAYFWLHDLFAHCPSINLLRNEASFCGGPPAGSAACRICHAGAERPGHLERIARFFGAVRPVLLAPSQTILDEWRRIDAFPHADALVIPPAHGRFDEAAPPSEDVDGPLRVGFLGTDAFHKGWDVFAALAMRHGSDPRYRFHQLAYQPAPDTPAAFHRVEVTPADREAMARAVGECGLDVVINWSRCFESFSFTALEALCGGAFVVARRGAGNVHPLIQSVDPARGIALGTETELQALFADGSVIGLARAAPRRRGRLQVGAGTATAITGAITGAITPPIGSP